MEKNVYVWHHIINKNYPTMIVNLIL